MKWFYIIALGVVVLLGLSPLVFLWGEGADQYEGLIVRYDSYSSAVKSVDSATCGDTTSSGIQGNFYESLYCYHYLKRPVEVIPQLAEGMPEISADRLTYTIKIKKGVKYVRNPCFGTNDDGTHKTRTVRAEDFVLAFKRVADYHLTVPLAWSLISNRIIGLDDWREKFKKYRPGDFSRYDKPVEGAKALDEHTLQIRLRERFPQFTYVLAMHPYAPIPREAVDYWLGTEDDGKGGRRDIPAEKRRTEFREAAEVVGTGPYILKTFRRKHRIVMVRNPEFREEFYPSGGAPGDKEAGLLKDAGKRVPFIDVLHYDYIAESYSAWMRFLSKQSDASGIPKENFELVITPGKGLAGKWRKRRIYLNKYTSPSVYWIVFNMEDPILGRSKSLRQAMCLAYDVKNYIKVLHNGRGKRAANILPSTFKAHKAAGPGPYYRLDLEAAEKKLRQAKKELGAAGLLENGEIPELKFDVGDSRPDIVRMTDFTKQQFAKIGIKVKVIFNDWPTLQQKVHSKQAQMYTMGWHADYLDGENFFQLFYSPNIRKGTNNANYSNPRFDELYEKVRGMEDTPERTGIYAEMVNMISEDCPVLMLSEPQSFVLYYDWMRNIKHHPIGYGFGKYIRIDTELRKKLGGR
ncbi:MAG: hypothetical protein KAU28_01030 [Phycisphaerae bacterium]|nr:hypothetical protein [Phycisphaerae bacterium]